jgi:AhpD family alkylhydroperoxidase
MGQPIRYVAAVPPGQADGLVGAVYTQMRADFGRVAEPFAVHSPSPALLAGAWSVARETLLVGQVPRGVKESIASAVSAANRCPWCVDVHTTLARAAGYHDAARAVDAFDARDGFDDRQLATLHRADEPRLPTMLRRAAATRSPGAEILHAPPFDASEAPGIIGVAVAFHYINRIVSATLPASLFEGPTWLRGAIARASAPLLRGVVRRRATPGASLALLPEAPLPAEFSWAAAAPHVARAFAGFAAAVEDAAAGALPADARGVVADRVRSWDGSDPGLSRRWVADDTRGLDGEARAGARLAVLAALAPHQIDADVVAAYRGYRPDDAALVATLAWGSYSAARRIASWLAPAAHQNELHPQRAAPRKVGLPAMLAPAELGAESAARWLLQRGTPWQPAARRRRTARRSALITSA